MFKTTAQAAPIGSGFAACPKTDTLHLHQLHTGDCVTIVRIHGALPMRRRLAEMGLLRGVDLVIKGSAPLGDPVAYEVKGYRLALRRTDAAQIEVRLVCPEERARAAAGTEVSHG